MDKLKQSWQEYPRGWLAVLLPLIVFVPASWGAADFILNNVVASPAKLQAQTLKIMITAALSGTMYLVFDIGYYISRRGAAVQLLTSLDKDFQRKLKSSACREVWIFASHGDEAKSRFLNLVSCNLPIHKPIKIRILLRSDGTPKRIAALEVLVDQWKADIDKATLNRKTGFVFSTEFSRHNLPVMLKGYIVDDQFCALSWYARSDSLRSTPNMPFFVANGKTGAGKLVIEEARRTFDHYFTTGEKM